MNADIKDLMYLVRHDVAGGGQETRTVAAVLAHMWLKIPHVTPGGETKTHFDHVFPNARFVGDNADGFGTATWSREIKHYETPVLPSDAPPLVVEEEVYDEQGKKKRNFVFRGRSRGYVTSPPAATASSGSPEPTGEKKPRRNKKEAVAADENENVKQI